jgi:hypothetical protein
VVTERVTEETAASRAVEVDTSKEAAEELAGSVSSSTQAPRARRVATLGGSPPHRQAILWLLEALVCSTTLELPAPPLFFLTGVLFVQCVEHREDVHPRGSVTGGAPCSGGPQEVT